jgi:hypothetical protein
MTQYTHDGLDGLFGRRGFALELEVNGETDTVSFPAAWWDTATPGQISDLGFVEYTPPDPTLEDLRATKIEAINAKLATILTGGYTVPESVNANLSGKTLQTRDDTDRTNWLTLARNADNAVIAGQGNATSSIAIRTSDNSNVTLTWQEIADVMTAMAAWGASAMDNSWTLKDAVRAAEDKTALDAVDIEAGWPA